MKGRDRSRGAASGRRDAGVWYPALRLLALEPEPPAAGAQMCGARRVPDLSGCSPHLCPDAAPRGTEAYTSKATTKPCEGRKQRDVPSCTQVMCSGMSCTAARACRERPLHCPPPPQTTRHLQMLLHTNLRFSDKTAFILSNSNIYFS